MSYAVLFIILGIISAYLSDKVKQVKKKQEAGTLKPEDKKFLKLGKLFGEDNSKSTKDIIATVKKKPILLVIVAPICLVLAFSFVLAIGAGIYGLITEYTYKEFSTEAEKRTLKSMNCDDLFAKNVGKEIEFCGNVDGGWLWVFKKDLYNSKAKYCCNPMKYSESIYCRIPFGQYDFSRFEGLPNNGIYAFKGTISTDCKTEYRYRDYTLSKYCVKNPKDILPADDKTRARMGRY